MRFLLIAFVFLPIAASAQFSTATYTVTFESTWSAATHPDDFPPDPHFSGLIGAAHDATAILWEPGGFASPGIEDMAETGAKTILEGEINTFLGAGSVFALLSGGGIATSPGSVSLSFDINSDYPLVSLVSMVAPSPDWFVGVNSLELFDGTDWSPRETITLFAYDAGTDSGIMYTSPDADTQPAGPIVMIDGYPFFYNGALVDVGTFDFVLDNVVAIEDENPAAFDLRLSPPYPNPSFGESMVRLDVGGLQPVRVELFDMLGRRVRMIHEGVLGVGSHQLSITTDDLPSGAYVLRVSGAQTSRVNRLIVQ